MRTSLKFSTLFHLLAIAAMFTGWPILYLILFVVALYKIVNNFNIFYKLDKEEFTSSGIYILIILLMVSINFFNNPMAGFHFIIAILTLLTAIIFIREPIIYYYSSKIALITFQCTALIYVLFKGLDNFPIQVPFANIIEGHSANGTTSYMVVLQLNFLLVRFLLFRKVTFYTSIMTLVVALLGYGRGSIVASSAIIILCLFTHYALKSKVKFVGNMLLSFFIILFTIQYYFDDISYFIEANTKLKTGIVDEYRAQMIRDYLGKINFKTFFFGADYYNTSIMTEYDNNPHNSFIRAHHIFGLPYLLFIIIFPFYAIFQKKGVLEIFVYTSIISILFFRAFSEPIITPTIFDFYYFAMFLLLLRKKSSIYWK